MSAKLASLLTAPVLWLQDKKSVFSHMCISWLLGCKLRELPGLKTAATDGVALLADPDFLERCNVETRAYVAAHEASHAILRHIEQFKSLGGTQKGGKDDLFSNTATMRKSNIAMDIWINHALEQQFGSRFSWLDEKGQPVHPMYKDTKTPDSPKGKGKYILPLKAQKEFDLDQHDWYWIFQRLDLPQDDGSGGGEGDGIGGGEDIVVGDEETQRQAEQAAARAVAAAREIAKIPNQQAGNTPEWMKRLIDSMGNSDKNWRKELDDAHTSSRPVDYSFRQLRKPYIYFNAGLPTLSRPGMGRIVCAVDTSGSITGDILTDAATELHAIWKQLRPELIYLLYIDTEVHNPQTLDPDEPFKFEPIGGGGTCFEPAFDWAAKEAENVDLLIYITDGHGSFPAQAPEYPVIWVVLRGGAPSEHFPWGKVVRLAD